jgi:hypothetical protein
VGEVKDGMVCAAAKQSLYLPSPVIADEFTEPNACSKQTPICAAAELSFPIHIHFSCPNAI